MSKELVKIRSENQINELARTYRDEVEGLKITSRESYAVMVVKVRHSKLFQDAVKGYFESIRKPAYDALQAVYAKINEALKPFLDAEKIGKQRMKGWEQIEAQRQREAQAKFVGRQRTAIAEGKPVPVAAPPENRAHVEGVEYVDNWKGRQVAPMQEIAKAYAAGKVPEPFLIIDQSAVNRFAQQSGGKIEVPGFEWYNDKIAKVLR
jgi:hypothetical protein